MVTVDERLTKDAILVDKLPLCQVYLKNNAYFPWLVLVPRVVNVSELFQLNPHQQQQLMGEVNLCAQVLKLYCDADKMNVASLGNIVKQLHVHVVARFESDASWPHSIWQEQVPHKSYCKDELEPLLSFLRANIK